MIEAVKLIGKRGLSYRGNQFEVAYTLDNPFVDHGNFLEIILFLLNERSLGNRNKKEP